MNNDTKDLGTILVLGSTGKTGRRVAERLEARGVAVRRASRSAPVPFDWNDPSTFPRVLAGVSAVYLSYYPDLAAPDAPVAIEALARAAVPAGVKRIVLLSGRGEPDAARCEELIRTVAPKIALTVVRGAWFFQNFSEGDLVGSVLSGDLAFPAGDVPEPFVDAGDIADVAVKVLLDAPEVHAGKIYEMTGPRLLRFADVAAEIRRVSGRPVKYRAVSEQQYAEGLSAFVPPDFARFLAGLFARVLDGRNAHLSSDIETVLGRKPRDFSAFAEESASAWAPSRG